MGRFVLRRLAQGIVVILGVTIVVFVVTRMIGDPVKVMLPVEATEEQRALLERQLGFDRPILEQFGEFAADLATFDLGDSLWQRRSALDIVGEHLPRTFQLVGAGMLVAILLSVPLGVIAALRPGSVLDRVTVTTSLMGLSIPQFWLGLILIIVFSVNWGWFPTSGMGTWKHLVLPAVTLG
ncbi:MAG: ABC transporter permease, partial [Actinomycetota bacterium]